MTSSNDQMFLEILKEEKSITNFLDAFFGFLFRCTDFYIESESGQKLGFPPGVAENLVRTTFKKWQLPPNTKKPSESSTSSHNQKPQTTEVQNKEPKVALTQPSESYNGAVRDNYSWSQTISDLDVIINVPSSVLSAKDLKVDITSENINISVNTKCLTESQKEAGKFISLENIDSSSRWTNIFNGKLSFKTRKEESLWSFIPGQHVSVHLEKYLEKWWESLLIDEPKIELSKIDCSRDMNELGDSEQMKVEELMWNQQQKLLGKPTLEQVKMNKILKQAWDAEGSPFKGQPFDPSVVQFE